MKCGKGDVKNMDNEQVEVHEAMFTKEQIVNSNKFKERKDLLNVVLEEGMSYTLKQVESILKKSLARKVN